MKAEIALTLDEILKSGGQRGLEHYIEDALNNDEVFIEEHLAEYGDAAGAAVRKGMVFPLKVEDDRIVLEVVFDIDPTMF